MPAAGPNSSHGANFKILHRTIHLQQLRSFFKIDSSKKFAFTTPLKRRLVDAQDMQTITCTHKFVRRTIFFKRRPLFSSQTTAQQPKNHQLSFDVKLAT